MVSRMLLLTVAAAASLAVSQTAPKPAAPKSATPKAAVAKAAAAKPATTAHRPAAVQAQAAAVPALPPGVPPVAGPIQPMFTLRYQEIAVGSGPVAEPHKVYKVAYTGYLAADGYKFDASADHPAQPVYGHDLQVVKGEDGKPKTEAGQPFMFLQGRGQVVPGFDNAFDGMRIGGKRRVFIPYQLAYGAAGHPTGDPKNPGIPPKADLIFDMELVDVMDLPAQPPQPQGVQVHAPAQPAAAKPAEAAPAPASPAH